MLNADVDDRRNTPLLSLDVQIVRSQKLHCQQIVRHLSFSSFVLVQEDAATAVSASHCLQLETMLGSAEDHMNDESRS